MNRIAILAFCAVTIAFAGTAAAQQKNVVDTVLTGCKQELAAHCKAVTPGRGRILACLYAYSDKLSGQCEYALYDASIRLERAVAGLSYVINECKDDLRQYCAAVQAGEGRLLACLKKNEKSVQRRCVQSIKDVGLPW